MVPVICIYIKLGLIYLTSGPIYLKLGPIYLTSGPIYLKLGPIYLPLEHIYVGMASSEASEASELWERESASTSTRVLFGYFTQISSRAQTSDQASLRLLHPNQLAGSNQRPGFFSFTSPTPARGLLFVYSTHTNLVNSHQLTPVFETARPTVLGGRGAGPAEGGVG